MIQLNYLVSAILSKFALSRAAAKLIVLIDERYTCLKREALAASNVVFLTRRQNSVDQFVLCQAFGLRCCLQVFVRDMKVAVPQVVADGELTFAHLRQPGSHRMPKSVPAHAHNADLFERRLDLPFEHGCQIEWFFCLSVFPKER